MSKDKTSKENLNSTLSIADVMLRFKLRLNAEEWGMYKKVMKITKW